MFIVCFTILISRKIKYDHHKERIKQENKSN